MIDQNQTTARNFNRPMGVVKAKRPYDPTNNKGRGYGKLWSVWPDYWSDKWGQKPCLGHVRADTEYDAVYAAYDRGLSHPSNCTFGLQILPAVERAPRYKQGK